MKQLSRKTFIERTNEAAKAMKIFIPNVTHSVNEAFALYQQILADDEKRMPVTVSARDGVVRPPSPYAMLKPPCPECGMPMTLLNGGIDEDGKRWETSWSCGACYSMYYSEKTPDQWLAEMTEGGSEWK